VAKGTPSKRVEVALRSLLLRSTRLRLQAELVEGIAGVDPTTYPVLSGLATTGPTTASRLAEMIGLDRTVTTRYLSRLEEAGLVARSADRHDARATRVELTAAGSEAAATMRRRLAGTVGDILDGWSKRDAERFAAALEKFSRQLRKG
jgi:DNA-binding MarR family transcriptional regulator